VFYPIGFETFGEPNDPPRAPVLAITEVMYNPPAGGIEYLEIQNSSLSDVISLANVELEGIGFTFPPSAISISPGDVVLIVNGDPEAFRTANSLPPLLPIFEFSGTLDNGGETLRIQIPEPGEGPGAMDLLPTWDHVRYDDDPPWPTAPGGTGEALHRILRGPLPVLDFGSDPASWESAAPSPGVIGNAPTDWRAMFFNAAELADPSISGPLADADGDRLNNLLEYLMGSDPRDASSTAQIEIRSSGDDILIDVPMRDGVSGYDLVLEQSDTLETWAASGAAVDGTTPGGGVTVTHYSDAAPPAVRNYRARAVETP
jgi:hypothetical protein